ncbi:hypothetical protein D3273_12095 [Lichenibacterium minor]|uniref:Uncharacterized protein n=1 Tax=Lichenibacterium minor TaxID=2316528 RepID=A0A4Q2U5J5_9HYPH|nr:hypothetical protein [Lichenibacterium minor]RYC31859.1 hypothetical protein D3273_12095 [Lichenibacterium minor]
MTPTEKLDAKVANEQLKLFANLLNTLAAPSLVGSLIAPTVAGALVNPYWSALVAGLGVLLHLFGWLVLGLFKPEQ